MGDSPRFEGKFSVSDLPRSDISHSLRKVLQRLRENIRNDPAASTRRRFLRCHYNEYLNASAYFRLNKMVQQLIRDGL